MTVIRPAGVDDARAVATVHVRAWHAAYRGLVPDGVLDGMTVDGREPVWRGILAEMDESKFTLVAVGEGGRVEGFCSVIAPSRDEDAGAGIAEVAATYVDPDRWLGGVGGALLGAARAELLDRGWRGVTLWVFAANARARLFYERFGLAPDGAAKRHDSSGQELIRMRAALGD